MRIVPFRSGHNVNIRRNRDERSNFSPMLNLQEEMNRLFEDFLSPALPQSFSDLAPGRGEGNIAIPAVDVQEKDNQFVMKCEMPGLKAEDIDVQVNEGYVTIRGERKDEDEQKDKKGNYLRREMAYGQVERTIALPETADLDKCEAKFRNGVLTLEMPKKAEEQTSTRKIEVKQAA